MIPQKALVCETFATYPPLGRFAVRDMKRTVAVGVIKEIERKSATNAKTNKAVEKKMKEEKAAAKKEKKK